MSATELVAVIASLVSCASVLAVVWFASRAVSALLAQLQADHHQAALERHALVSRIQRPDVIPGPPATRVAPVRHDDDADDFDMAGGILTADDVEAAARSFIASP